MIPFAPPMFKYLKTVFLFSCIIRVYLLLFTLARAMIEILLLRDEQKSNPESSRVNNCCSTKFFRSLAEIKRRFLSKLKTTGGSLSDKLEGCSTYDTCPISYLVSQRCYWAWLEAGQ